MDYVFVYKITDISYKAAMFYTIHGNKSEIISNITIMFIYVRIVFVGMFIHQ